MMSINSVTFFCFAVFSGVTKKKKSDFSSKGGKAASFSWKVLTKVLKCKTARYANESSKQSTDRWDI